MHSSATTAEPYPYKSLFSYAGSPHRSSPSPLSSTTILVHPAEGDNGDFHECLDTEQQVSAAILAHEHAQIYEGYDHHEDDDDDDDDDSEDVQSMSASLCTEHVSVSPAAMFLSAFTSPKVFAPLPDAEGQVVSGYTLSRIVGYGAFSTIRLAYSPSGDVVAVKIVKRSDHFKQGNPTLARKRVKHEAAVWSAFSHEHILPLFSAVHTSYADFFFTLYCPAGSLFDILKRDGRPALPQDDVGMMFRQVVRGLRYLHEVVLFVHRDIKLENVLVDESGVCRIGDFGMTRKIGEPDEEEDALAQQQGSDSCSVGHATVHRAVSLAVPGSKRTPRTSLHAQIARHRNSTSSVHPPTVPVKFQPGSLPYAAPELLLPHAGPLLPHPAQDIWALGVLLYALLMGRLPFVDAFEPRLQMKILNGDYEVPPDIGRGAERVLQGCLDRLDTTRWTIAMVDEVAWGIGWGAEGDDVTPADSDEEFQAQHSPSRSRSRCEDTIPADPEWQHEEPRSRASMEAASRRSSSRIKRSLSRAPVPSVHPLLTRSVSRHSHSPAPSPPVCALNASGTPARSPPTARSPSCGSSYFHDTTVLSPPASLERGRQRQKMASSHSPSPSSAPTTPTDADPIDAIPMVHPDDTIERSSSRGRRGLRADHHHHHHLHLYSTGADSSQELDVLDEGADWTAPTNTTTSPSKYIPHSADTFVGRRIPRSHSKPSYIAKSRSKPRLKVSGVSTDADAESGGRGAAVAFHKSALTGRMRGFPTNILTPVQPTTSLDRRTRSRSLESLRL
ncbi:hypothetical protein D9615_002755 [Tricholomella constricta]|uniref:Protein kinase domain-containing protein n=1 Tax=Tricholomella constricta TaxID=117010 RepID=A0A8H5HG71_9AGAR|nr:hypothetical protein D9615_002755 [Tricholomella constricta]